MHTYQRATSTRLQPDLHSSLLVSSFRASLLSRRLRTCLSCPPRSHFLLLARMLKPPVAPVSDRATPLSLPPCHQTHTYLFRVSLLIRSCVLDMSCVHTRIDLRWPKRTQMCFTAQIVEKNIEDPAKDMQFLKGCAKGLGGPSSYSLACL